jgi:hypothetical protein
LQHREQAHCGATVNAGTAHGTGLGALREKRFKPAERAVEFDVTEYSSHVCSVPLITFRVGERYRQIQSSEGQRHVEITD